MLTINKLVVISYEVAGRTNKFLSRTRRRYLRTLVAVNQEPCPMEAGWYRLNHWDSCVNL